MRLEEEGRVSQDGRKGERTRVRRKGWKMTYEGQETIDESRRMKRK